MLTTDGNARSATSAKICEKFPYFPEDAAEDDALLLPDAPEPSSRPHAKSASDKREAARRKVNRDVFKKGLREKGDGLKYEI